MVIKSKPRSLLLKQINKAIQNQPNLATNFQIVSNTNTLRNIDDQLVGTSFVNKDFSNANLTNKDFSSKNFTNVNFTGSDLTGSDLTGANFTNANLTGANLTGANLTGANLTGANPKGANFSDANLTNTIIINNDNIIKVNFVYRLDTDLLNSQIIFTSLSSASNAWTVNTKFYYYGGTKNTYNRSYIISRIVGQNNVPYITAYVPLLPVDNFGSSGSGGILIRI